MKKTASIMTLLLIINIMSASIVISTALAEITEVNCGEGYTEYYGSLCGANFYILIPNDWTHELGDGMLVVICRPGSYVEDPREFLLDFAFAKELAIDGIAVAASNYGPDGDIKEGVEHTHRLTLYVLENYCVTGKVFLFGTSTGGAVALLLGEQYPDMYSGVLDNSGVKDPALGYHDAVSYTGSDPFLLFWNPMIIADSEMRYGGTPDEKPCEYAEDSPLHHADMAIPVLSVIHADDAIIPPYHTEEYHAALCNPCLHEVIVVTEVTPGAVPWFPNASGWYGHFDPIAYERAQDELTTLICWSNTLDSEACPETCPKEPACPEEPECPQVCPEEPECPKTCPDEPVCPEEPTCPEEPVCPISITPVTTVGGGMVNGSFVLTPIKATCDYIVEQHEFVWWNDADDPRGDLYNHNTLFMIWTGVPWMDDGFFYATRVIRDGPCPDDTVLGQGYMTGKYDAGTAYMSWSAVDYFTAGYQIISWDTATSAGGFIIEGWDNDDFACAWPEIDWTCPRDVTYFTGWAKPAMMPPVLDPGVLVATTGEFELHEGTQVNFYHYWDDPCWVNKTFGKGETINTFSGVNNLTDGASLMWGTSELTFDCVTFTGAITGYRWMDKTAGDWITISSFVSKCLWMNKATSNYGDTVLLFP
jgi:hypothetical protein